MGGKLEMNPPNCKQEATAISCVRMSAEPAVAEWSWLSSGREMFPAMLAAIEAARESVCLETYIYAADYLGERFLAAARHGFAGRGQGDRLCAGGKWASATGGRAMPVASGGHGEPGACGVTSR